MKKLFTIFLCVVIYCASLYAQSLNPALGEVFRDDVIPRIDIKIPASSLNAIYANVLSDIEHKAQFIFDNGTVKDTLEDIGFRLRGNTSRHAQKKSFKVSFNSFVPGRKYHGLEKMNLNGEHNDPSIARAKICWNILREMNIPASRANHVEVYINDTYYGLYLNVEHIDEEFVESRFGNNDGNLYKGYWGVDFNYKGSNPDVYKFSDNGRRIYELKTNTDLDDYSDLAAFIATLNNEPIANLPCKLEEIFNVDQYLKVLAFDVVMGHWDGPVWNMNNCYLYKNTETGKFEFIPYDLDNTIGVSWMPDINWTTRNIYSWSAEWGYRPLYQRLLQVQEYKDRYAYYMNELLQKLNPTTFFPKIDQIKSLITNSVLNDTYRILDYNFSVQNFHDSFDKPINYHTPHGIKDYLTARMQSANNQLILNNISPVVKDLAIRVSVINKTLQITANAFDDNPNLTVKAYWGEGAGNYQNITLLDDGNHNDGNANDGIYGGTISLNLDVGTVNYYVSATDSQGKTSRFPRCLDQSFFFNSVMPKLVINELMASNETAVKDEAGELEDWVEIYNADQVAVNLADIYLSDNPNNPTKWKLPNFTMLPNSYLLVWADEDGSQGLNHANFKLSKNGETIGLYFSETAGFATIDEVAYPEQTTDVSYGRLPNGTGDFQFLPNISPKTNNEDTAAVNPSLITELLIFPNPFTESLNIQHPYETPTLMIYNSLGQLIFHQSDIEQTFIWDGTNQNSVLLSTGVYFITLLNEDEKGRLKVIETKRVFISRK
jgi:spore coat protein CotH